VPEQGAAPAQPKKDPEPEAKPRPREWLPREGGRPSQTANPVIGGRPDAWVPDGLVKGPPRPKSRPDNRIPAELEPPAESAPPPAPPPPAPPPPATTQPPAPSQSPASAPALDATSAEFKARLAALEDQIEEAQRRAVELEARRMEPSPPSEAETAAVADSFHQLHEQLADLRSRMDSETGRQRSTIDTLETRVAAFEEEVRRKPGYAPAPRSATAVRVMAMIALFLVIAGAPLFMTRREKCHPGGRPETHWKLVKPFDDAGEPGCDNQLGGSVLLDAIGTK
jgi:hypothetical protein